MTMSDASNQEQRPVVIQQEAMVSALCWLP